MGAEKHLPMITIGTQEDFIEAMKSESKNRGWRIALLEAEQGICLMNRGGYSVSYFEIRREDITSRDAIIEIADNLRIDTRNLY